MRRCSPGELNLHGVIETLDAAGYRRFGFEFGAIIAVFFGLLLPWAWDLGWPLWPWIAFGVLAIAALAVPMALKPFHYGWMTIGHWIGKITTPIVLAVMFYLLIFPCSVIMKLFGHDPMRRKLDTVVDSYRLDSKENPEANLEYPF